MQVSVRALICGLLVCWLQLTFSVLFFVCFWWQFSLCVYVHVKFFHVNVQLQISLYHANIGVQIREFLRKD